MKAITKVLVLLSLLFVACSEPEVVEPQQPDIEHSASLDEVVVKIDNSYTRTVATLGSDNHLQLFWSKGDALLLTDMSKVGNYTLLSGDNSATARFKGSLESENEVVYAIYPHDKVEVKGGKIAFTIPTEQSFTAVKAVNIADKSPMFGVRTEGNNFTMSAVVSAL